uniref:Uncharacterized protein n=1 Tax=Myoviridae sp. ctIty1 TaxID=2827673 RepID=A0A8S5TGK5_9CAUD|nr:MAG TPA: hypothetical protein [Myoviridae sp. ctIty1]
MSISFLHTVFTLLGLICETTSYSNHILLPWWSGRNTSL